MYVRAYGSVANPSDIKVKTLLLMEAEIKTVIEFVLLGKYHDLAERGGEGVVKFSANRPLLLFKNIFNLRVYIYHQKEISLDVVLPCIRLNKLILTIGR
jgi:hypothetical protein